MMIRKNGPDVPILRDIENVSIMTFPCFDKMDYIVNGFSTKKGGVSKGIYESMNLSFNRGDDEALVRKNYEIITNVLGVEYDSVVMSDQTHTVNVRRVTKADRGLGLTRAKEFFDTDGLITNAEGVTLVTFFADCVPLYFVDTVNRAIGLSHSGWRGTINEMGKVTLLRMNEEFGTNPKDVVCAIGPSICQDCYEVSEDVAIKFIDKFGEDSGVVTEQKLYYERLKLCQPKNDQPREGKYQLNLWKANQIILEEAGVLSENISVTNVCTCCNSSLLFSHRATQGKRGNLAAFLALK